MGQKFFWVLMAGLVGTGLLLVFGDQNGTVMGLPTSHFARMAVGLLLVLFVGQGLFRYTHASRLARDILIWGAIGVVLILGYSFRGEFGFVGDRLMGELIPGRATSFQSADGLVVRLRRGRNGQYSAQTEINGVAATALVDTGASDTVLNFRTAEAVGINTGSLIFSQEAMTANGISRFAGARVETLMIGDIVRRNVPISVAEPGKLGINLLGMSFLNSLSSFEFANDTLVLRP
jgi:aspartyl protease family protein